MVVLKLQEGFLDFTLRFFWGEAAIQLPQLVPLEAPPARPAHPVVPDAAATVRPVTPPVAAAATGPPVAPEAVLEMPLPKRLGRSNLGCRDCFPQNGGEWKMPFPFKCGDFWVNHVKLPGSNRFLEDEDAPKLPRNLTVHTKKHWAWKMRPSFWDGETWRTVSFRKGSPCNLIIGVF